MGEEDRQGGPHLHEQDFGRTIRGTSGALLLLTRGWPTSNHLARHTREVPNFSEVQLFSEVPLC